MKKILFLYLSLVSISIGGGYICETSKEFQDYINGNIASIPQSSIYTYRSNCDNNCYSYKECYYNDSKKAHQCLAFSGQIKAGDIGRNLFSNKTICEVYCRAKK